MILRSVRIPINLKGDDGGKSMKNGFSPSPLELSHCNPSLLQIDFFLIFSDYPYYLTIIPNPYTINLLNSSFKPNIYIYI